MSVGDLLEWLAASALVAAAFIWSGSVLALAVAAVCLAYFGQCYSGNRFGRRKQ